MLAEQVSEFMDATGQRRRVHPSVPTDEEVRLRLRLVMEEAFELLDACTGSLSCEVKGLELTVMHLIDQAPLRVDLVGVADALADIDYVVEGTRQCFGIDGEPIALEVHTSNMRKVCDGHVDEHGKFRKPDDWRPPDVEACLLYQGMKGGPL